MPKVCLRKGVLIVFEGLDGAGKSTQAKKLFQRLREAGFETVFSKEPTDSLWGRKIQRVIREGRRNVAADEETEWFIRDRQEHVASVIQPSLHQRKIVVLDRYYFSTIAYQGALGVDPEEIERRNVGFAPLPDLLFMIDISPPLGLQRIAEGRRKGADFFEREHYLTKVSEIFSRLNKPFLHRLRGEEPVGRVENQIWSITMSYLHENGLIIDRGESDGCNA